MATIHATSSFTANGQTILPKVLRQRMKIVSGALIACRVQNDGVSIDILSAAALQDVVLAPFLNLLQADIETEAAASALPPLPPASLGWGGSCTVTGDIDMPITGKVAL